MVTADTGRGDVAAGCEHRGGGVQPRPADSAGGRKTPGNAAPSTPQQGTQTRPSRMQAGEGRRGLLSHGLGGENCVVF